MKLRFYARAGQCVHWPGVKSAGSLAAYAGRSYNATTRSWPALAEPFEVEDTSDAGKRFTELTRRDGALWPADPATAAHCGVSLTPVVQDADGEWIAAPAAAKARPTTSSKD